MEERNRTDERDTSGRPRDELTRAVASTHADALSSQGGFEPEERVYPDIEINWKKDRVRVQVFELAEDGKITVIYEKDTRARDCRCADGTGPVTIEDYLSVFPLEYFPDNAFFGLQILRPRPSWWSFRWWKRYWWEERWITVAEGWCKDHVEPLPDLEAD